MTLFVVDASAIVAACLAEDGWRPFSSHDLVAPPLALSEASSALHEARWRGEISDADASLALQRLIEAPVALRRLDSIRDAWETADLFGWAKTYDAECVALARSLGCPLVTLDARLARTAARLIEVTNLDRLG